jgi:hypothetical protein
MLYKPAHQNSSRSCPGMLMFRWLFLFPAKGIWPKPDVSAQDNNKGVLWGSWSDCWLGLCGFVPLVLGGSHAILVHGARLSSKPLVMLRWDSSTMMFIIYVTFAEKRACFPEQFCSNSWCGLFQVSFPNKPSNLLLCNNCVWKVFQRNFYLLCVVCLQRLQEEVQNLQFMSAMREKANNVRPVSPSTISHLDFPRTKIVAILLQDNRISCRYLHKMGKMFEP